MGVDLLALAVTARSYVAYGALFFSVVFMPALFLFLPPPPPAIIALPLNASAYPLNVPVLFLFFLPAKKFEANVGERGGSPRRRRLFRRPNRQAFALHLLVEPVRNVLQHPVLEVQTPYGRRLRGRVELPLAGVGRGRNHGEYGIDVVRCSAVPVPCGAVPSIAVT